MSVATRKTGPAAGTAGKAGAVGLWLVALCIFATFAGLGPALPVLLRERALAGDLQSLAEEDLPNNAALRLANETKLRRTVQAIARARGFSLPLEGVVLSYAAADQAAALDKNAPVGNFEAPALIGYTLPITLPLFGIIEYTALAVRVFGIRARGPIAEGKELHR